MGSTASTVAMGRPSASPAVAMGSEEKLLTVPTPPQSMTRFVKMARPVTVLPPGEVSPVTL